MREIIDILMTIIWFVWTGSLLPQIYKIWKRRSAADLSVTSLWIGLAASVVSAWYGFYVNLWPLIDVNIFGAFLYAVVIGQYFKYRK